MSEEQVFRENTEKFAQWVQDHFSRVSTKFKIDDLREQGQGRGLIATEDIAKNERLFELSRDCILNVTTAAMSKLRAGNRNVLESLNQWQALIICVAYEWLMGDKSRFAHYFRVLPLQSSDYNSLMFWSEEELETLKPSGVLSRIGREAAEEMHALLVADIIPNRLQCPELAEFLTQERFHVVASLIMSYSFDVDHFAEKVDTEESDDCDDSDDDDDDDDEGDDGGKEEEEEELDQEDVDQALEELDDADAAEDRLSRDSYLKSMVPLADTLNSNTSLVNATLKYEKSKLVMIAEKKIKKGEQIFNIYGELPNTEILRKYGYVELPSSKFDFAEILQPSIRKYFQDAFSARFSFIKESQAESLIDVIFETIQDSDYLAESLTEDMEDGVVADRYEVYANGEVLTEMLLLLLIISSILVSGGSDEKWFKKLVRGVERKPSSDLLSFINRTILKSHQLLEENSSLTSSSFQNLKELVKLRIAEYPPHITDGTYKLPESYSHLSRKNFSDIALFGEVKCLRDMVDGKFPPLKKNKTPKFNIIDDKKFLKNLLKRKLEDQESKLAKKQKKH
ncbi:hypothetical protein PICMEDRAFT_71255 [Pichia membranifaciens NRRL Y-2026]|uniref:SET domain-containing protein n=1 Tax=Pichia membranifaciens NRRL Y-2026 TaxID=763406 RepID=A0A1E3NLX2_9ASCO|nr:hypothetical protein PICMEDRAFT_71255 [Pichia membranifaciens NRRL Y-2026]ODQ47144.1 hypothetical protein PICMEDRAFT_71255 [Pichia membranifaciens NRRL Y-2026]